MELQTSNSAANLGKNDQDWQKIVPFLSDGDDAELLYFLYKGLIFPKENTFMLRCRTTGAELDHNQLLALADIAETHGGGYADITTRANFQIREIPFSDGIIVLKKLLELGIAPPVTGLNNLRNVTITPTTGFDPVELTDVSPIAKEIFHELLYNKDLQGLPGKFNIALDSGGKITVASATNDIGIKAVSVDEKLYFRLTAADLRGEKTIAQDLNWLIKPDDIVQVVATIIKTYLQEGDFSIRLKSRIKFLIKKIGIETFKSKVKAQLNCEIIDDNSGVFISLAEPDAHLGIQSQKQKELCYMGVNGAAGRYTVKQLRLIASTAENKGNRTIRLTTLQNCLIPYIDRSTIPEVVDLLQAADLTVNSKLAGHIIACTGSAGCSFSATATKAHSLVLFKYLQENGKHNEPINIHFTGCSFSCAQTYIGDIGLIGVKSKGEECYHIFLGGGAESNTSSVRIWKAIPHQLVPSYVKAILDFYATEKHCSEDFNQFVHRFGAENFNQSIVLNED